jgi:hypothetical protein
VLVLDLDEREAAKLLAVHDSLAGMAEANGEVLAELLDQVETESDAIQALLDGMLGESNAPIKDDTPCDKAEVSVPESYQVVIECRSEAEQQTVFERMTADGYTCRLLML